ncbi:hypothetical protein AB0K51_18945 [Kitasatospora sp. NPDC049285]|uniref:hypothetical protein n=1 Tax=Kitasatospora sp. NPDC049285 TaxID=3157096 RepID=UPI003447D90D
MNTTTLAGPIQNFGNSWANTLLDWTAAGLMIALTGIVIIYAIRKMSVKAAIGGAIGLVICWSLFTGRYTISNIFQTEYSENKAPSVPKVQGAGQLPRELPVAFTGQLGQS